MYFFNIIEIMLLDVIVIGIFEYFYTCKSAKHFVMMKNNHFDVSSYMMKVLKKVMKIF